MVQLPEGGAVLVHPVGSEAVLVVAEAVIPAGTDAAHFREGGGQNLAIGKYSKNNVRNFFENLQEMHVCTKNILRRTVSALLS